MRFPRSYTGHVRTSDVPSIFFGWYEISIIYQTAEHNVVSALLSKKHYCDFRNDETVELIEHGRRKQPKDFKIRTIEVRKQQFHSYRRGPFSLNEWM